MNLSPSSHREVLLDLPQGDPPRIRMPRAPAQEAHAPLSLEAELAQTRALRLRCERLLGELGCPVEVEVDADLQRGAA